MNSLKNISTRYYNMTLGRLPLLRISHPKLQRKQGRDNVFSEQIVSTQTRRNSKQSCKNQYSSLWIICFALNDGLVRRLRYVVEFTQTFLPFSYSFVYAACPQVYTRDSVEPPTLLPRPAKAKRAPLNVWRPTALNNLAHLLHQYWLLVSDEMWCASGVC